MLIETRFVKIIRGIKLELFVNLPKYILTFHPLANLNYRYYFYLMKKLILLSLIALASCSKSRDAIPLPTHAFVKVDIQKAVQKDYSGVTMLELTVDLTGSSLVSACDIRVYKTDINSEGYIYSLTLKDGVQVIVCQKYTSTSPLVYQIRYVMKSGKTYFSDMLSKGYN